MNGFEPQQRLVRMAARALGRNGLAHAYGHCSVRIDEDRFLVCAAMPMGLIPPDQEGTVVPVDGPLPEGVLGEVRLHQQIYTRRPEINGVCRSMPQSLMALSALGHVPKLRHGMAAYFWPGIPLWSDVRLIRDDERARLAVRTMGDAAALVLRGNGAVVAGETLQQVCVLNWFLEDAARIELEALKAGLAETAPVLDADTAAERATWSGGICERMWSYLTAGDPEGE